MQQNKDLNYIYKDVVIIGNGPSGICLSYLLAGNWPHYTGEPHPGDDMLTARLRYYLATSNDNSKPKQQHTSKCININKQQSQSAKTTSHCININHNNCFLRLNKQDLESLSTGLEGRNNGKPLSLLMDQLQHPCLDAGFDNPSLMTWKSHEEHLQTHQIIDHIVLGKGPPGGAWHSLDPNVLTISLKRWMSLPGLDLRHWESKCSKRNETKVNGYSARVPIGTVAAYYKDYVTQKGLEKYFKCGTIVTSVRSIPNGESSDSGYDWIVEGFEHETNQNFRYRCKKVILATGTADSTNFLGVPGEDTYQWVTHDFKDFEKKLDGIDCCSLLRNRLQITDALEVDEKSTMEPILIVGSGLSAADAIIAARSRGIPVLHVFRNLTKNRKNKSEFKNQIFGKLKGLPESMYPEYHKVYEMMINETKNYPHYKSLPDHVVIEFSVGSDKYTRSKMRRVTLCTPQNRLVSYRVSFAAVLIGYKPDLSYLKNNGIGLGKIADKPIDSRSNPIEVDVFSYEVERASRKGLYAVGPLAGDNFVRFILGGAFGAILDIINSNKINLSSQTYKF